MDEKVENQQSSFSAITKDMCSIGFESFEKCFKEQMDKQNERKSKLEVFASGAGDESKQGRIGTVRKANLFKNRWSPF